jgi:hypothetical protein
MKAQSTKTKDTTQTDVANAVASSMESPPIIQSQSTSTTQTKL